MSEIKTPITDRLKDLIEDIKSIIDLTIESEKEINGIVVAVQSLTTELTAVKLQYDNEVLNSESLQRYWQYTKDELTAVKAERDRMREAIQDYVSGKSSTVSGLVAALTTKEKGAGDGE